MSELKTRNTCLDFLKGIACIFVVFMHCEFPGNLGVFVQCISRFCVPFFFMVSGYFAFREDGKPPRYAVKLRHIGIITLAACALYLAYPALRGSFPDLAHAKWGKLLLFNEPNFVAGQLWFLFALLYVYLLWAIVDKWNLYRIAYGLIPVLFLAYILLAQGSKITGLGVPNRMYRNFLIEGFPFFMLGHWIHRNENTIHLSNQTLVLILVITTLLCPAERMLMGRDYGVNIVTFPQVTALFLLGVKNPTFGAGSILTKFGLLYSMFIYILHPFVMGRFEWLYGKIGMAEYTAALYAKPILVLLCTIVMSAVILWAKNRLFKRQVKT